MNFSHGDPVVASAKPRRWVEDDDDVPTDANADDGRAGAFATMARRLPPRVAVAMVLQLFAACRKYAWVAGRMNIMVVVELDTADVIVSWLWRLDLIAIAAAVWLRRVSAKIFCRLTDGA